jgi:hypothetical protein
MLALAGLVAFGLALGIAGIEIFSRTLLPVLVPSMQGTKFDSIDDIRRTLLMPDSENQTSGQAPQHVERANLRELVDAHPNDRIIFDLRPNLDVTFQRARVETNSCGMRGPETSLLKPLGTYRIALLGDSFTFGWGVEQSQSFAQRLEDNLNRISQGNPRFEVLNFGVPGYSTFQEVAHFLEIGLEFDPDEVLVFFVQNDFDMPFYVPDTSRPGSILSSAEFLRLGLKGNDTKVEEQRMKLRGLHPDNALTELSDVTRARGIRLSLSINPRKEWKQWRDRLPVLRERPDIRLLNMRPDFVRLVEGRKIASEDLTLSFDPHPSPLRHALYGDLLTPFFMDVIP